MNEIQPKRGEPLEDGPAREGALPSSPRLPPRIPDHELLRLIGRGAYGEVWLARSLMGEYRAVKVVYRQSFDHDRPYEREFAGSQKFEPISRSHECQVDILHVGRNEAEGYFYYVMELAEDASGRSPEVQGPESQLQSPAARGAVQPPPGSALDLGRGTLDWRSYVPKTLKSELQQRGRLPAAECVKLGLSLTTALEHLHTNGLVHRDGKPSNIIFIEGHPKLADIGLVTSLDATRSHVGTLGFAPPEGPGTVTGDLYSLGKVLYEAATGRDRQEFPELPTRLGGSPQEEAGLVELNEVILKACDSEPSRRYQSAEAMRADLAVLEAGQSLARNRGVERRLAVLVKAAVVLVALAVGALLFLRHHLANLERLANAPAKLPTKAEPMIPDARPRFQSSFAAVRSQADQYPRVIPGTAAGKNPFTVFRLNVQPIRWGSQYEDAIRFTTPAEKGLDLAWAFTLPKTSKGFNGWWLMPAAEGSMGGGFRGFFHEPATQYENVPAPTNKVLCLQGLPGKWLEPNRGDLMCFEFQNAEPVELQIAMNFVPTRGASETNRAALEKALGLILSDDKAKPERANRRQGEAPAKP